MYDAVDKALREAAARYGVALTPDAIAPAQQFKVAYPLGILATDHVGYLSFDLTRLPADVYKSLMEAVDARRADIEASLDVSVWFYAFGSTSIGSMRWSRGAFPRTPFSRSSSSRGSDFRRAASQMESCRCRTRG